MYTKLFSSVIYSSIWSEDSDTCKVWVTLMALQDREGYVYASTPGLARICALPVATVEAALAKFMGPDPYSSDMKRVPERQGQRIEQIRGGWRLLNASHYRDLRDADERRSQNREAQQRSRVRRRGLSAPVSTGQHLSAPVSKRQHRSASVSPSEAEADPEADAESESKRERERKGRPRALEEVQAYWSEKELLGVPEAFFDYWNDHGWGKDWRARARNWSRKERELRPGARPMFVRAPEAPQRPEELCPTCGHVKHPLPADCAHGCKPCSHFRGPGPRPVPATG